MKTRLRLKQIITISGILFLFLFTGGCIQHGGDASSGDRANPEMDAWCEIQEFNLTIKHNQTIVPVTDDDLKSYPEFEKYLRDENNNPPAWNFGTRLVKDFQCNESRALKFIALSRKFEENPNQPVLEYHGHYYKMWCDSYWGTTARPTIIEEKQTHADENS
jgi:hypothetical protein